MALLCSARPTYLTLTAPFFFFFFFFFFFYGTALQRKANISDVNRSLTDITV
jgi:hypothetical protein